MFILDPFNEKTGGTYFLPGSHLFEKFPSDHYVFENEIQPELDAGDVVLMNSFLYHRAGLNTSSSTRALITTTYTRPSFAAMFNRLSSFDARDLSEREKEILGYRWNYNQKMVDWRKSRINGL